VDADANASPASPAPAALTGTDLSFGTIAKVRYWVFLKHITLEHQVIEYGCFL